MWVMQIFINLFSNVVKYNCVGGSVSIEVCWFELGWVEVVVCDMGFGLSDEQCVVFFQFFNCLGCENSGLFGIGIGLVISQCLVEMMGGSLRVEGQDGFGVCFVLRLLVVGEVVVLFVVVCVEELVLLQVGFYWCVFYVEDNLLNVDVMCGIFEQCFGLELEVVMMV